MFRAAVISLCTMIAFSSSARAQEKAAKDGPPPAKWQNPVREYLKEGKPVIGGTVTVNSVDVAA